jgi:hypothetical protein
VMPVRAATEIIMMLPNGSQKSLLARLVFMLSSTPLVRPADSLHLQSRLAPIVFRTRTRDLRYS